MQKKPVKIIMKTTRKENTTSGSFKIPKRRCEGFAGPFRKISSTDAGASGSNGAGRENNDEDSEEGKHFIPVRDVIRKTELLGWDVWPANHNRRKISIVDPDDEQENPEEE